MHRHGIRPSASVAFFARVAYDILSPVDPFGSRTLWRDCGHKRVLLRCARAFTLFTLRALCYRVCLHIHCLNGFPYRSTLTQAEAILICVDKASPIVPAVISTLPQLETAF